MPSIVATPYPTRGQVLLDVNFSDIGSAFYACVEAVTGSGTSSEVRRPLHPYISYSSDGCQTLSCGQAVFWDTEISCDVPTIYCATAVNSAGTTVTQPAANLITDTFTRTVASDWGTADSGQPWAVSGGALADYSVTGTRGQMAVTSTAVNRVASIATTTPNVTAMVTMYPAQVAVTQATEQWLILRGDATAQNGYKARVRYNTGGTVDLIIEKVVAGVATSLGSSLNVLTYIATTGVALEFQAWGSSLNARIWDVTTPEPSSYQVTVVDTTFPNAGPSDLVSLRNAGNTNGTVNFQFDNFSVVDVCASPVDVQVCTEAVTIECDGCFRLGDPVRPCNDVKICLCADGVACGATGGLFFAGMTPENYASNSGSILPVNSKYPITISRTRMAPTGELDIVATSFVARDALLDLLSPGDVLFWRGPANYGITDKYMAIGDVPVSPQLADLTIQPRFMALPFQEEQAPVGPTLGVCGARFEDLCDVYPTWNALIAAGLTYADLLRGDASTTPSGLATWNLINAQNANWNTLLVNEPDWNDVLDGD